MYIFIKKNTHTTKLATPLFIICFTLKPIFKYIDKTRNFQISKKNKKQKNKQKTTTKDTCFYDKWS